MSIYWAEAEHGGDWVRKEFLTADSRRWTPIIVSDIRLLALAEPDLETIWLAIAEI